MQRSGSMTTGETDVTKYGLNITCKRRDELEMLAKDYGHSPIDQGELVSGFQRSSKIVNLYFIKLTLEKG